VEFFGFLLLLFWFIRWNRHRRQQRVANPRLQQHPIQNFSPNLVTPLGQSNPQAPAPGPSAAEGWFRDPTGRYAARYWSGQQWTEWVSTPNQQVKSDPIVANIPMPRATSAPSNVLPPQYRAPEPGSQVEGPDLNELRRRFQS